MNYWVVLDAPKPWAVGAVFSSGTHITPLGRRCGSEWGDALRSGKTWTCTFPRGVVIRESYSWFGIYVLLTLVAAGCWLCLGLGISFCKYSAALPLFPSGRILSF
jgi:hypothetical protein